MEETEVTGHGWILDCGNGKASAIVICQILKRTFGGAWDFRDDGGKRVRTYLGRIS